MDKISKIEDVNKKTRLIFNSLSSELSLTDIISSIGHGVPFPLNYNFVEVKNSNVHGRGLFATRNMPPNVIITYYPAHAIIMGRTCHISDNNKKFGRNIEIISKEYSRYLSFDKDIQIIGNPNNVSNPLLLGHMINDGGCNIFKDVEYEKTKDITKFKNLFAEYYILGSKRVNCHFCVDNNEICISVVTKRKINKGEELFALYDPIYWFNLAYDKTSSESNHCLDNTNILLQDANFNSWLENLIK
jgi:hypothetical protein